MMASHNVEGLPTRTREAELAEGSRDILYLSVSGNLAAMFQLNLQADSIVKKVDAGVEAGAGCAGSEECGQLPFPAKTVSAVPVPGIFAENSASFHA